MSAHTPGPWHVGDITFADVPSHDGGRKGRLAASIHNSENRFTMIRVGARSDDQDEVSANAHLVAAAPEMKTALARQLSWLLAVQPEVDNVLGPPISDGLSSSIATIRAILARAEGRHP